MILAFALIAYASAMTVANLLVVQFGPVITPLNAFFLIGLDLALRDWLHVRLRPWQMGALIAGAGLLAWLLNPAAQTIAIASAVSFAVAALVDWIVFVRVSGSWLKRSMKSNIAGAAVDSLVFPWMAFGAFMPAIFAMQFVAKVAGGSVWAFLLSRFPQKVGCMTTKQADDMLAVALRNLRSFLGKASFETNVDLEAALNCVDVIEQAIHIPKSANQIPKTRKG